MGRLSVFRGAVRVRTVSPTSENRSLVRRYRMKGSEIRRLRIPRERSRSIRTSGSLGRDTGDAVTTSVSPGMMRTLPKTEKSAPWMLSARSVICGVQRFSAAWIFRATIPSGFSRSRHSLKNSRV